MIPNTLYLPIPDGLFVLSLVFVVVVLVYLTVRLGEWHQFRWFFRAKRDITEAWEEIADERDENVAIQERLTEGWQDLAEAQKALHRRAKEVEAAVHAQVIDYDTEINLDELPEPLHPNANELTIEIPVVRDET